MPPYGSSNARWPGDPLPMFRLTVYNRKTHYILWVCTQSVQNALSQKNRDRNFDDALTLLLNQFLVVAGKRPASLPVAAH